METEFYISDMTILKDSSDFKVYQNLVKFTVKKRVLSLNLQFNSFVRKVLECYKTFRNFSVLFL